MAIDENDPRLKDMLRAIELGDIPEDLPADPEDYDEMGGIKSLDRGAPSIKMASGTGAEEFELELGTVIAEYNDLKSKGDPAVRDISLEQYIDMYLSKKKMMEENRAMVMGGGMMRMNYADGNPEKLYDSVFDAREAADNEDRANIRDMAKTSIPVKKTNKSIDLDIEAIKKLIEKRKKEKKKLAMGGIAGVL